MQKVRSTELHQQLIFLAWLLWQSSETTVSSFSSLTTLTIRDFIQTPNLIMALLLCFKNSVLENLDLIPRMEFCCFSTERKLLVVLFLSQHFPVCPKSELPNCLWFLQHSWLLHALCLFSCWPSSRNAFSLHSSLNVLPLRNVSYSTSKLQNWPLLPGDLRCIMWTFLS